MYSIFSTAGETATMPFSTLAGFLSFFGSSALAVASEIATAPIGDRPEESLINYIISHSGSTVGISVVLGFVVWYLVRQQERNQVRYDAREEAMKKEHAEEIRAERDAKAAEISKLENRISRYEEIVFTKVRNEVKTNLP